jgi:4-hydroxy-3-polyprenylbenzoate decarboxylase
MKTYYVAVDDDIDPSNLEEVIWAMATRADPATTVDIIRGGWTGGVDPRLSPEQRETGDWTMGRMLINACKPFSWRDQFPKSNVFSADERRVVEERWRDLLDRLQPGQRSH